MIKNGKIIPDLVLFWIDLIGRDCFKRKDELLFKLFRGHHIKHKMTLNEYVTRLAGFSVGLICFWKHKQQIHNRNCSWLDIVRHNLSMRLFFEASPLLINKHKFCAEAWIYLVNINVCLIFKISFWILIFLSISFFTSNLLFASH